MLRTAFENGICALDTARAYGDSEDVIGRFLKTWEGDMPYICTKIRKFPEGEFNVEKHVIESMETSLEKLGIKKVNTVMLHSPVDIMQHGEKAYKAMRELLKRGYADRIGVSVYVAEEIEEMLRYPEFSVTQVPMSIFDQRLISSGTVAKLKNADYTVFVRSVFLQGLFFLDPDTVTDPILVEHALPGIRLLNEIAASEGMSIAQLAIAFMRDTAGVTSLVLGADTPEQVKENISYFDAPSLSPSVIKYLNEHFANTDIPEIMKVLSRPKKQN
jgi:aryl-alcohol dehydrogenase-like predicted oxidoreductase